MNECNSIEAINKTYLTEQTNFWLSEIIGIIFTKRLIKENHALKN